MKKQFLLFASLLLLFVFSCKKDRLDAPRGHPLTQPDTNSNWISSGFDTENSCLHQMPYEGINLEQRAISKAIYDLVAGWVPSFNAHGQPIWEGTISTLDSTSGEYTNIVPLIDDEADSVKSIFFVAIRQGTFDYFFFHKKGFLEHRQDSIQLQDNGQAVTLTSNEILALFDHLQYYLYCSDQITERGPTCPNWNDWWKDLSRKLALWKLNFQNWIHDLFAGPGGDDGPPGDYGGVSGGVFWGEGSTPVSSGQWTSFGGGGGGIFFTDEDIINNYYNTICQWYDDYDPESEFNEIPASILPGGSYDELQAKKCCALSVLQDGGNPMDNPVLADLLSDLEIFDNALATWVCENGSPLDDNELEMVSVFVVMKTDGCGDLAWRDFKQLYEWVVDQPSTSSLTRQEMANVHCLMGTNTDPNMSNEDWLELILDNNCETDDPYTDNEKCVCDAYIDDILKLIPFDEQSTYQVKIEEIKKVRNACANRCFDYGLFEEFLSNWLYEVDHNPNSVNTFEVTEMWKWSMALRDEIVARHLMAFGTNVLDVIEIAMFSNFELAVPKRILNAVPQSARTWGMTKVINNVNAPISSFALWQHAQKFGINTYNELVTIFNQLGLSRYQLGVEFHHLIEQRFLTGQAAQDVAQWLGSNTGNWKSVVLSISEHQAMSAKWLQMIPKSNQAPGGPFMCNTTTATINNIKDAAREVYKDFPEILLALGL
jgi:hypothetical protein